MPPIQAQQPLNLAIIGGGIAGLTLTIALLKYTSHNPTNRSSPPHLTITLYESAPAFGEIGAGVGFEPCMVRVMELIDPRIKEGFLRCANQLQEREPPKWFSVRVGDGRKEGLGKLGETVFDMPTRKGPRGGVHRAHFLEELVKLVPEGVARFCKKVVDVREDGNGDGGGAVLRFSDGSVERHDAVIACDGIKSRCREIVLGPEARPVFSGKCAYRGLIPMEKAIEIMKDLEGEDGQSPALTSQMFCGYHGHVLTFPIAHGKIMNVVAFSSKKIWKDPKWVTKTTREDMLADYKDWGSTVQAIMRNMKNPDIWALFNHPHIPTYHQNKPKICLLGDAAHASTPHQGAGAGMCIEDCYILGELLGEAKTVDQIEKAFSAYEAVRRPRTLKLVQTSREAGMLWEFEGPKGDDLQALEENAKKRMNWIWDHDITVDLRKAKSLFAG